jgi:hypothetical protein
MDDRELIRSFEAVHDRRRLAFAFLAIFAVVAVLIGVVVGFRGSHVSKSADAIVFTGEPPTPAARAP